MSLSCPAARIVAWQLSHARARVRTVTLASAVAVEGAVGLTALSGSAPSKSWAKARNGRGGGAVAAAVGSKTSAINGTQLVQTGKSAAVALGAY